MASSLLSLGDLTRALEWGWDQDSSSDPAHWSKSNPASGQCAVTALIVQDHFGGSLLRIALDGLTHYWNVLPGDETVDLTLRQFGPEPPVIVDPEPRTREYVLSFPDTVRRYRHLRSKVDTFLHSRL